MPCVRVVRALPGSIASARSGAAEEYSGTEAVSRGGEGGGAEAAGCPRPTWPGPGEPEQKAQRAPFQRGGPALTRKSCTPVPALVARSSGIGGGLSTSPCTSFHPLSSARSSLSTSLYLRCSGRARPGAAVRSRVLASPCRRRCAPLARAQDRSPITLASRLHHMPPPAACCPLLPRPALSAPARPRSCRRRRTAAPVQVPPERAHHDHGDDAGQEEHDRQAVDDREPVDLRSAAPRRAPIANSANACPRRVGWVCAHREGVGRMAGKCGMAGVDHRAQREAHVAPSCLGPD